MLSTPHPSLHSDPQILADHIISFLTDEFRKRGYKKAVIGMSGGIDSALSAYLTAQVIGAHNILAVKMPYRTSNPDSIIHADLVIDSLRTESRLIDISPAVDGYLLNEPDASPQRRGNVMARIRMITLFDLSAKLDALVMGTGNLTERLFGYFTWHADDAPPVNPLGNLLKTQVWGLSRYLGVPDVIIDKAPSADLIAGQTDEHDLGISYEQADGILSWILHGAGPEEITRYGYALGDIELVNSRIANTEWKRQPPSIPAPFPA